MVDLPPALMQWRLRALGLKPGDRILVWTPSSPAVPALYYGAMRAGVALVPLDLRMSSGAIERIVGRADAQRLIEDLNLSRNQTCFFHLARQKEPVRNFQLLLFDIPGKLNRFHPVKQSRGDTS